VIAVGDRVRGEVLDVDPERRQVYVSLKALQPEPAPGQLDANG
jgi:ribosomal protein S1